MQTSRFPDVQSRISVVLLTLIGSIFVFKYSARFTHYPLAATMGYACGMLSFLFFSGYLSTLASRIANRHFQAFIFLFAAALCVALQYIPSATGITRLVALDGWLEYFQQGLFPYDHPSYPSGFPVLFLAAVPFRILGDFGYMEVAGFIILGLLIAGFSTSGEDTLLRLLLLLSLPTFYVELLARSELLFNMSLVLAWIYAAEKYGLRPSERGTFFMLALGCGLILSTRAITAIIFAIYLVFRFRGNIRHLLVFSLIAGLVFLSTLLPFVVWNPDSFFHRGPFAVQLSYLPSWGIAAFIPIAFLAGWKSKSLNQCFFLTGCVLLAMTLAACLVKVWVGRFGLMEALFESRFDIFYFVFCTPFFILSFTGGESPRTHRGLAA